MTNETKPRRVWVAVVFTLFSAGLGHLYAGALRRGLAVAFGMVGLGVAILASSWLSTFRGLVTAVVVVLGALLAVVIDAARVARRRRFEPRARFQHWAVYLGFWLVLSFVVSPALEPFFRIKSFRIAAGSMEPTLVVGDRVMADLQAFRHSATRGEGPARGDVVLFADPKDPKSTLTKRVIGLGGERIELRDKKVFIDGAPLEDPWGVHNDPIVYSASEGLQGARDNPAPLVIPEGSVYVMGDNRDHSFDSRFLGPVPLEMLRGKLLYIYFSQDRSRIGSPIR